MSRKGYTVYQRGGKGHWYVAWVDGTGKRCVLKASGSKAVATEVGRAKAAESDRVRGGVIDPSVARTTQFGREPASKHVDIWIKALKGKGNTPGYVKQCLVQTNRVLKLSNCTTLREMAPELVQGALGIIAKESSPQNARHFLTALRMFVRWCIETDRLAMNPIKSVKKPNVAGETFQRRAFTDTEFAALLHGTRTRQRTASHISGDDRAVYYQLMAYTGLRRNEARSLTPESFQIKAKPPTLTVEAAYSKHRRRDIILLRADFAKSIAAWLENKKSGCRVFGFPKHANMNRVFKADAKAAGIVPASDKERVGIHSLRRFFITRAVRAGGLAVAQDLARHSTPALTKKYADLTREDHMKGLGALPRIGSAPDSAFVSETNRKQRKAR